ncbi:hypothetical protein ACJX0J_015438, partial [Zea mays]
AWDSASVQTRTCCSSNRHKEVRHILPKRLDRAAVSAAGVCFLDYHDTLLSNNLSKLICIAYGFFDQVFLKVWHAVCSVSDVQSEQMASLLNQEGQSIGISISSVLKVHKIDKKQDLSRILYHNKEKSQCLFIDTHFVWPEYHYFNGNTINYNSNHNN